MTKRLFSVVMLSAYNGWSVKFPKRHDVVSHLLIFVNNEWYVQTCNATPIFHMLGVSELVSDWPSETNKAHL
jgi:hypothetical protein